MQYHDFMNGMVKAPFNHDECGFCGGNGLKAVMCCSGHECGCRGMPVDFEPCDCGSKLPTDEQIIVWGKQV